MYTYSHITYKVCMFRKYGMVFDENRKKCIKGIKKI